ncbi:MAG TPA: hypothetical protein VGM59_15515 [Dongiaceae bacterium]|jgi:hypothetical protein
MTGSKSTEKPRTSSPDKLAKPTKSGIELSESALDRASGGAVFPSSPAVSALKMELKIDDLAAPSVKLPIVKPGN